MCKVDFWMWLYIAPSSVPVQKTHKFDYETFLPTHQRLLLDTVVPESSSISSVLAANLDVRQADLPKTVQRIVYDDGDNWKYSDLALLGLGAPVIPFTKFRPVLSKFAGRMTCQARKSSPSATVSSKPPAS